MLENLFVGYTKNVFTSWNIARHVEEPAGEGETERRDQSDFSCWTDKAGVFTPLRMSTGVKYC